MVSAEGQAAEGRANAQLVFQAARHAPAQGVVVEVQLCQVGEAAQLRRYLPTQAVGAEVQRCNAPVAVGGDVLPFIEGRVAQPVITERPFLTVRCVVEGNQGFPVRFVGAGGRGRLCRRYRRIGGSGRVP